MCTEIKTWQPRPGWLLNISLVKCICPCCLSVTLSLVWKTLQKLHCVRWSWWNSGYEMLRVTLCLHMSRVQGIWKTHLPLLCLEGFKTHLAFLFGRGLSHYKHKLRDICPLSLSFASCSICPSRWQRGSPLLRSREMLECGLRVGLKPAVGLCSKSNCYTADVLFCTGENSQISVFNSSYFLVKYHWKVRMSVSKRISLLEWNRKSRYRSLASGMASHNPDSLPLLTLYHRIIQVEKDL